MVDLLDNIAMDPSDRALAKSQIRDAERVADLICSVSTGILSMIGLVKEGFGALVNRMASAFKKPAHH